MRIALALVLVALSACASIPRPGGSGAPATFVQSVAESRATRMIDVRDGMSRTQALRVVTDVLSQRFTVEVTDSRAGFAMTSWQASVMRDGAPDLRYRTRVTAKFVGEDWRRVQVRSEANWARGEEWDVGHDAVQLDSVSTELRARLGRR